jgi:hypothetical protein
VIRREGRVDNPHIEPSSGGAAAGRRTGEVRSFERQLFVAAVIGALMLGAIAGVNGLIAMFP